MFKVQRVGGVQIVLNVMHIEIAFVPATCRGLKGGKSRVIFGHEDLQQGF